MTSLCDGDSEWVASLGNRDASGLLKSFDVPTITGLEADAVRQLATLWNRSGNVLTIWSSRLAGAGDDGAAVGTVVNLHLITGQVGRPGAGPFGLHATASGRGSVESGASPITLPGGVQAGSGTPSTRLEELWDPVHAAEAARLPPGLGAMDIVAKATGGELPVLLLLGGSVSTQLPDRTLVEKALGSVYVVCTAAHLGDPDVAFADLVLPAPAWYEREAYLISSERRVARSVPSLTVPEGPRAELQVLSTLGSAMVGGELFDHSTSQQVMEELRLASEATPADLTHLPLGDDLTSARGVQWPVVTERSASLKGTARRYLGQDGRGSGFPTMSGKALIVPREHPGFRRPPSLEYPMTAIIGIDADGWWDGSYTPPESGIVERSTTSRPSYVELTREDAEGLGLAEGDLAQVTSTAGTMALPVWLAQVGTAPGHAFIPWHPKDGTSVVVPSRPIDRNGVPPWSSFPIYVERVVEEGEES
jgi:predicted molibdopterin-dependent oxidoreductase YjgC